jgi:hypothetical protein
MPEQQKKLESFALAEKAASICRYLERRTHACRRVRRLRQRNRRRLGKKATQTVLAFYDLAGEGVSLRRSPDCSLIFTLAQFFGGGGHAAAAGADQLIYTSFFANWRSCRLPSPLFSKKIRHNLTDGFPI